MILKFSIGLLCYLLFFFGLGVFIMGMDRKKFQADEEDSFLYGNMSKRKIVKKKAMADVLSEILYIIGITLVILSLGFSIGSIEEIRGYWNGTGEYVDKITGIMFNIWMALMGVLVVLVSFVKKTWLTFTADDVVKRFRIRDDIVKMGLLVLTSGILQFFKSVMLSVWEYHWYFGFRLLVVFMFVAFMHRFLKLCYWVIESFFGDKIEHIFLDSLYEELWYNPVRKMNREDNWKDDDIIRCYADYFIEKYLLLSKRIELEKIHKIGFTTNLYTGSEEYKQQRYKIVKKRSIFYLASIIACLVFILSVIVGSAEVMKKTIPVYQSIFFAILSTVIVFGGFLLLGHIKKLELFVMFAIVLTNGRCSYELRYKEDSRDRIRRRFVREVPFFGKSIYSQYVRVMKSLIAFYMIAPDEAKPVIANDLYQKCLYRISESEMCLPLIVIDYLNYINPEKKELLPGSIEISDVDLCKRLTRAFCLDIGRRCFDCTEEVGIDNFEKYMEARIQANKVGSE